MTVLQKVLKNNSAVWNLPNYSGTVSQPKKAVKKVMFFINVALITLGSMALSFYIMFLR